MPISVLQGFIYQASYTSADLTRIYIAPGNEPPILIDDLMIIVATRSNSTIGDLTSTGWNQLFGGTVTRTNSSRTISIRVWWKFREAGDTVVTHPNIDANPPQRYFGYVVRGVDKASPFDIETTLAMITSGGGGATVNPAAVTPVTPGAAVLYWMHDWSSSGTSSISWNSPFSQLPMGSADIGTGNKVYQRLGYQLNWTSGAVDGTVAGAYRDQWLVLPLILRPAGSGNIKVWNGSAWVAKPAKVWNGSAWVQKPIKRWNGSAWVTATY
jgi:hypothetical protein